jgi:hypothetical protein
LGSSTYCLFISGVGRDHGRQSVPIESLKPGRHKITLKNASPTHAGTWINFDYLALKNQIAGAAIFVICRSDAPPNYTRTAFDELCDLRLRLDCTTTYIMGETTDSDFINGLNDWNFNQVTI